MTNSQSSTVGEALHFNVLRRLGGLLKDGLSRSLNEGIFRYLCSLRYVSTS